MIKAIIFDCFGVLTTDGYLPFRDKYFSQDKERFAQATALDALTDAGRMSYNDFVTDMAKLARIPTEQARRELEDNVADNELFAYIKQYLKPHYKLGMLSNAAANWLPRLFSPNQIALFDATALSFEIGHIKPEPEAYLSIAERLNTPPQECLFIDDQPRYIEGAAAVNMPALLYASRQQLQRDLKPTIAGN